MGDTPIAILRPAFDTGTAYQIPSAGIGPTCPSWRRAFVMSRPHRRSTGEAVRAVRHATKATLSGLWSACPSPAHYDSGPCRTAERNRSRPGAAQTARTMTDTLWRCAMTYVTCTIEGCEGKHHGRGWCRRHYKSWQRLGDPLAAKPKHRGSTCSIEGCEGKPHARGWCPNHYGSWRLHGDPMAAKPTNRHRPPICTIEECDGEHVARGWCSHHYESWLRHGDPLAAQRRPGPGDRKLTGQGYAYTHIPGHPLSSGRGKVLEHRKVMYDLGLLVDLSDVVHHVDRDKLNNDPSNLMVMTASEHKRLHLAEDAA